MTRQELRDAIVRAYGGNESATELAIRLGVTKGAVVGLWMRARDKGEVIRVHRSTKPAAPKPSLAVEVRTVGGMSVSLPRLRFLEAAE